METNKRRAFWIDFIRVIALLFVFLYHFNVHTGLKGAVSPLAITDIGYNQIDLGQIGVCLFFFLSGLTCCFSWDRMKLQGKKRLMQFYKKRWLALFPVFYVAFVCFYVIMKLSGGITPDWRIIYSVFQLDRYLARFGYETFGTVGEWFTFVIILCYFVFPLLRVIHIKTGKWIFALLTVLAKLAALAFARIAPEIISVIPECLTDFMLGMCLYEFLKNDKVLRFGGAGGILVFILLIIIPTGIPKGLKISFGSLGLFMFLAWIGKLFEDKTKEENRFRKIVFFVARFSYPFYLIHSIQAGWATSVFKPGNLPLYQYFIVLIFTFLLAMFVSICLTGAVNLIQELCSGKKKQDRQA